MQSAHTAAEHFDVLIVGAGISGIGAAYRFGRQPFRSFVVLEAEDSFGGTWLTNTFPGIRSDSDLFTFGYDFKPWRGPPIATAAEIQRYIGEVIQENGLDRHIRYRHRISGASWDSEANLWTVHATDGEGRAVVFTAGFLFMCQGYFRHREGFAPTWPGMDQFKGRIVHAQSWPSDIDVTDKNVLVVGSGATAATIVPRVAETARHATMLQRSPTYFFCSANANELADRLRALRVDEAWIHEIVRRDILAQEADFTRRCFEEPELVRTELIAGVAAIVGEDTAAKHFTPRYRPWQQRVAFLPNGDMLQAIRSGSASVETDEIERFAADGVRLKSGGEIAADIVVLATGFNMNLFGDIAFSVDGEPLDWARTVTYRGMMFTGVPNLAWVFGYFRSSWTLRSDLVAAFVMRVLDHMERTGVRRVEVAVPGQLSEQPLLAWIAEENFNPGYLKRALPFLPRRLDHPAWQHSQDYFSDLSSFPAIDLAGAEFRYG
ncbi:MAG: NAD(P)/FAD-dependent oxidoreductase [Hyphomonadaceae bacterium]